MIGTRPTAGNLSESARLHIEQLIKLGVSDSMFTELRKEIESKVESFSNYILC